MTSDKDKLQALRDDIDAIDDALHDLIMQRTGIVENVRAVKRGDRIKIRPAREAEILYRLMARHQGSFPKRELARIWRELIVATLRFEGPFSVAVAAEGEDAAAYWDMARDQYGSFTPMTRQVSCRRVIEAVRSGEATVGILPLPRRDEADPWWPLLVSEAPEMPRVIARLPFIGGDTARDTGVEALVICAVGQEMTGRDRSILAVEAADDIGFKTIEGALSRAGFSAVFNQVWHEPGRPASWLYLVEVFGFIDPERRQISRLMEALGSQVKRIVHLGGYATPLGDADLAQDPPGPPGGGDGA